MSFGYENIVLNKYSNKLKQPFELSIKKGITAGLFYAITQLLLAIIFSLIFFLAAVFIKN